MSEVSVKIYIYLLLFALPTKLVILAAKKIRLFWWSVFDRSLLSAFFFPHSITIQILVNWLFNNLFQNISGNWSLADCCEIPWVLLFLLKKKMRMARHEMADWEVKLFMEFCVCQLQFGFFFLIIFFISWECDCFHEAEQLPENLFFLLDVNLLWANAWRVFKWWHWVEGSRSMNVWEKSYTQWEGTAVSM